MRRLLLLTYTFPPDNTPAATRPKQLFDYLPERGWQPIVVASSFEGSSGDEVLVHRVPGRAVSATARFASDLARWFTRYGAPYDDRLRWVPHAVSLGSRLIESGEMDAIFSTSPYLASHFAALWLKRKYGLPWIADFQDPVRENPTRNRRWFFAYDALIERLFFDRADHLFANTDTVAAMWRDRYPQWEAKTSVLWNSFDPRELAEVAPQRVRSYRVMAHVGALYGQRHPTQVLSTLARLGTSAADLRVKLVGPIETAIIDRQRPLFERLCQSGVLEFENRLVQRDEARRETAAADYLLLLDLNDKNTAFQLPSKLLDYVRQGKPILAYTPKNSPVERILARSGVPFVAIDPVSSESVADQKVGEFLRLPPTQNAPSAWFDETFSARTQALAVTERLNDLLSRANDARHLGKQT